ncbi:MAG: DUF1731 domain-containing protein [Chloracidobacterium sp.]|nr:DUF1731 domain-containing protein [Chloracidobacterium sp.]
MIFGEMGDALLLASTKVMPKRLEDAGFEFKYPNLKGRDRKRGEKRVNHIGT